MRPGSAVVVVLLMVVSGCAKKADLDGANKAVKTALEAWKNGGTYQQLTAQGIEFVDNDWMAGYRLLDYELKTALDLPQQGPRVVVVLHLQGRAPKKISREVAYEVLMKDPKKISIGRDAFHVGS